MMKLILVGYGKMGKQIEAAASAYQDMNILRAIDIDNIDELETGEKADVIIDFSHPDMVGRVSEYAKSTGTALVCGTTGLEESHMACLRQLGDFAPVIYSSNYSFGVAVFEHILTELREIFDDNWDIEMTEVHHNQKIDAPSGTAKKLLDALDPDGKYQKVYGRQGITGARTKKEIGVHSIRGGTVAGEHTVSFFGKDEEFQITHKAASRQIFAEGALKAARILSSMTPGYYTLRELLFSNDSL